MQQRNAQLHQRVPNHPPLSGQINVINSEGMMSQPSASVLAMNMYEESIKHPHSGDSETSMAVIDANRMDLLKSATNHQGKFVQGNSWGMPTALQQMCLQLNPDIRNEVTLGDQISLTTDPSSNSGQAFLQSKSGLHGAGLNQGVTGRLLKGWPQTEIDQLRPSLRLQVQRPNGHTQNQFLLASQHQQALAQGGLGRSPNYGFGGLPRGTLNVKDGPLTETDGSICFSMHLNSPKMKMPQMQQASSQQLDQMPQVQQNNNRKRKQHSSGPANSKGTGNAGSPSPSSPSSTAHTPGDGITAGSSLQQVNSSQKGLIMYGAEAAGLAASVNQLDDLEYFGDVESFLSNDGGDGENLYGTLENTLSEQIIESPKGFSFGEVGCIRTRTKVTCCHFSSDGKLLASAGHGKKAVLWNMDTLQTKSTPEEHQHIITDVRFRPNSSQLATASFDKSVRLWDAANPNHCLHAYTGHNAHIMSLDFHPKKNGLFGFCDSNREIRYWNINPFSCSRLSRQGGSAQMRFQPIAGNLLAAATDKVVTLFDVETDGQTHSFQGHAGAVNYLCWDLNGDYLASVSEDSVKVWSLASAECIHELTSSNGNKFLSCVFHPSYSALLVIGGMRSLELWNIAENRCMTVPAHENIISGLAQSPHTGVIASASHDTSVKLWI